MLFKHLTSSHAMSLLSYEDVDHFRESERYVRAESMPLRAGDFAIKRAIFALAACSLSLVRTFPRIINGYEFSDRLLAVVPMDGVVSASINGRPIGSSLILLKPGANCTVHEPESRLVAILSMSRGAIAGWWPNSDRNVGLLALSDERLRGLQTLIAMTLRAAGSQPDAVRAPELPEAMETTLLSAFGQAMATGAIDWDGNRAMVRYKDCFDRVDARIVSSRAADLDCVTLADEVGVSARTLQTAMNAICGMGPHNYSQLRRICAVRRQLRKGAPGLTVRASALAYGFLHMSDFARKYLEVFGELPSVTLGQAKLRVHG